ncbi:MAG TPA: ferrous iron transport protein B [Syntrophorhabdaceae bacterium]|nr:ferrous iron transport protein B [Syntrophorhabdaceae bacterium]
MSDEVFPLSLLVEGEEGFVYLLSGGEGFISRLAGMGIIAGTRVKVLRNNGGQVIVLASDTRLALGKGQADKILIVKKQSADNAESEKPEKSIFVALAGQPNVGKSTIFNILTGLSQHVGNWPGKTVEFKEGLYRSNEVELRLIDLPGTYSLSAFSEEERVARDFLIHERPDIIVLIVNASALERSLYLLTELLLLDIPVIVGVNMLDVGESQGKHIDVNALHNSLGIPVVEMVASKNKGVSQLVTEVLKISEDQSKYRPKMPHVTQDHQAIYLRLEEIAGVHVPLPYTKSWVAVKLMEGDPEVTDVMKGIMPPEAWKEIESLLSKHEDALRAVLGGRYDWIEEVTRAAVSQFKRGQVLMTDRIDHILTRPLTGIPILLAIMALVFLLTFLIGTPLQNLLEKGVRELGNMFSQMLATEPWWVRGVLVNGIIGGAGSVLTFVPILAIFFFAMTFLEDIGYMARAAFVMDKFMHIIGLHGKSFIPMCLGFGCNVPSIMGTRIIESKQARFMTMFLIPFVPCTARLAVLTFVTAAIFAGQALLVTWSLVVVNIVMLGIAGILISRFFFKDRSAPFIMELPLYHEPNYKTILSVVKNRTVSFIRKAGTIILIFSILLWMLSNLPYGNVELSILARLGEVLEPIGRPIGLDWRLIVALLSSIIAKENSIATLGILYGAGEKGLMAVLSQSLSVPSALSFLDFLMLFIPCAATMAVMKQEMNSFKLSFVSLVLMLLISYGSAAAVFHVARAIGL